jgi:hypothetical protein
MAVAVAVAEQHGKQQEGKNSPLEQVYSTSSSAEKVRDTSTGFRLLKSIHNVLLLRSVYNPQ